MFASSWDRADPHVLVPVLMFASYVWTRFYCAFYQFIMKFMLQHFRLDTLHGRIKLTKVCYSSRANKLCLTIKLDREGRQRQRLEGRKKIFLRNLHILLSISLLWFPCMFLFSLKFRWLQRLLLNETMDVSSWNVGHDLKTVWNNGAVEVWFESRAAEIPALFHIFTCAFCLV